jgi:sugar-phosphatase
MLAAAQVKPVHMLTWAQAWSHAEPLLDELLELELELDELDELAAVELDELLDELLVCAPPEPVVVPFVSVTVVPPQPTKPAIRVSVSVSAAAVPKAYVLMRIRRCLLGPREWSTETPEPASVFRAKGLTFALVSPSSQDASRGDEGVARFRPRALVLDMDGLMVDSEPLWFRVERAFAAKRGFDFTHQLAAKCVGRGMAYTLATMGQTFHIAIDLERDTAEIVDDFIARVGELQLKRGCLELLAEAGGRLPLAVASSSPHRLIAAVLGRFALSRSFAAVVSGEDVARPKPAPDIFLHAAAALGRAPAECAVLEDSLAGATAGRAAGMFVIAVPEGPWERRGFDEVADRLVTDLFEACAMLDLSPA